MSNRANRSIVTFHNHETPITEAARVNAEKIAARSKGVSVRAVLTVTCAPFALLAVAKVAAVAINFFF